MAIIKLDEKYKSKFVLNLNPERTYTSSSLGITGEVYVFPNRSVTQKDNIDERLEFAGFEDQRIVPFSYDSLEQRRLEVFNGITSNYSSNTYFETEPFTYESGSFSGDSQDVYNAAWADGSIITRIQMGTLQEKEYRYDLNSGYWYHNGLSYRVLPYNPMDRGSLNVEVALAILLDGANEYTKDHVWRYQLDPFDTGSWSQYGITCINDSYTSQTGIGVMTGRELLYDEGGYPYYGDIITDPLKLNPWPPEIAKHGATDIINTTYSGIGYSDISMHPRNATKKGISVMRCNENSLSKANVAQKIAFNNIKKSVHKDFGWWVDNHNSLNLNSWNDNNNINRKPVIFWNLYTSASLASLKYEGGLGIEFWIKPSELQTSNGVILWMEKLIKVSLIPDTNTFILNKPTKFFIKVDFLDNNYNSYYTFQSTSSLNVESWNHIYIRHSSFFNNGQINIIVNGINNLGNTSETFTNISIGDNLKPFIIGGEPTDVTSTSSVIGSYNYIKSKVSPVNLDKPEFGTEFGINDHLKSEIMEFRIWNKAQTSEEISENKFNQIDDYSNVLYIPFNYNYNLRYNSAWASNEFHIKPLWKGNTSGSSLNEFYSQGSLVTIQESQTKDWQLYFPYDLNNAFTVGVPWSNNHNYLVCYTGTGMIGGYITGLPNYRDWVIGDVNEFIPQIGIDKFSMNYMRKNWKSLEWLRCINNLIIPSDNYVFDTNLTYNHEYILFGNKIRCGGKINKNEVYYDAQLGSFMDDEIYEMNNLKEFEDTRYNNNQITASISQNQNNWWNTTDFLKQYTEDLDYLNPTSIVINIPQIYYGKRIEEGTININCVINMDGKQINLKDNEGKLYRSSKKFEYKTKVGHVDYENGIIVIFHPSLVNMTLEDLNITFNGEKELYVQQYDIPCNKFMSNISKNKSYKSIKASKNSNDESEFTLISNINLHDENLNVIAKVNLAQPIVKREEDDFLFRIKLDF